MSSYRDYIIDHYKYPRNNTLLENPTMSYGDKNPVCGDELELTIKVDEKGKVEKVGFSGTGCAISQASASMLTELLEDMTIEEMKELTNEDIKEMLGIPLTAVRLKCAILSLKVLQGAILKYEGAEVGQSVKGE